MSKARTRKRSRPAAPSKAGLEAMQRWVQEVIMHPEGAEAGLDAKGARDLLKVDSSTLGKVILPSKNLTSLERINIYANAYYWRLMDIVAQDFPCVEYVTGEERLQALARSYIAAHPSTRYSLNGFGKKFPEFLRKETDNLDHREFLSELAALELTLEIVFDEEGASPLTVDDLLDIPQDSWGDARFEMIPALRLLAFDFPVDPFFQAWRDEKPRAVPGPEASWLAVFRKDLRVWRMRLTPAKFAILTALQEGQTLGAALEIGAQVPGEEPEELAKSIGDWFNDWTADGLFAKIELR